MRKDLKDLKELKDLKDLKELKVTKLINQTTQTNPCSPIDLCNITVQNQQNLEDEQKKNILDKHSYVSPDVKKQKEINVPDAEIFLNNQMIPDMIPEAILIEQHTQLEVSVTSQELNEPDTISVITVDHSHQNLEQSIIQSSNDKEYMDHDMGHEMDHEMNREMDRDMDHEMDHEINHDMDHEINHHPAMLIAQKNN